MEAETKKAGSNSFKLLRVAGMVLNSLGKSANSLKMMNELLRTLSKTQFEDL